MRLPAGLCVLLFLTAAWAASGSIAAQDKPESAPQETSKTATETTSTKPETHVKPLDRSWNLLTDNVQDDKHAEARMQALNALSDLKTNARAEKMIAEAMQDSDLDVRTSAVLAAGKTKSRTFVDPMRKLLDDPEPQVVFAAATTLWKDYHDRSGEDVLAAIAAGDRKANPSLIHGAEHDMSRTLHSPGTLAKIGIETGAGMVLGPFGFSVSAIEYARKNGGDGARVQAIDLLADVHTQGLRDEMKDDLVDSDAGVRAAAVRVVGSFHHPQDADQIEPLLDDSKLPVRLAAAAAYIDCMTPAAPGKASHR